MAGALPCPLRTLLVPCSPGFQWLTHSSVPLEKASTVKWLHSEETFSGGFPRLLTLSCVLSQSTACDAPSCPQTLVTLGVRPSEDKHVYLRGFASCSWPCSRCVVVSVPSMALWPPALPALLSWQSARSAVGNSQHGVINVAGNSLAQCPERF